jgi:hypothetical protein
MPQPAQTQHWFPLPGVYPPYPSTEAQSKARLRSAGRPLSAAPDPEPHGRRAEQDRGRGGRALAEDAYGIQVTANAF